MFVYVRRRKWARIRKLKVNVSSVPSSPARKTSLARTIPNGNYLPRAEGIISQAAAAKEAGHVKQALNLYEEGISVMLAGLKSTLPLSSHPTNKKGKENTLSS